MGKKNNNEVNDEVINELQSEYFESEFEFIELLKVLTEKECYIIKLIYCYGFSVSEIAQIMKISRQAVNKCKNRALKKLKNIYEENL